MRERETNFGEGGGCWKHGLVDTNFGEGGGLPRKTRRILSHNIVADGCLHSLNLSAELYKKPLHVVSSLFNIAIHYICSHRPQFVFVCDRTSAGLETCLAFSKTFSL